MKEILASQGWKYSGNCKSCSGGGEVWVRVNGDPNGYSFKVFERQGFYILLKGGGQVHRGNVNDIQAKITEITVAVQ